MPLLSSCFNFCQTYKFLPNKSPFVQMPFFVILCEYLARDFLPYSPFLPNFSLSPKICHFLIIAICQDFPLCHLIWGFAKPLMDSCRIPHFLQFAIFVKIANCQKASFVVSFKFFAWPLKSRFCVMGFYCMPKVSVCCLKWDTTYSMCEYENINPTGINTSLQVNILAVILK